MACATPGAAICNGCMRMSMLHTLKRVISSMKSRTSSPTLARPKALAETPGISMLSVRRPTKSLSAKDCDPAISSKPQPLRVGGDQTRGAGLACSGRTDEEGDTACHEYVLILGWWTSLVMASPMTRRTWSAKLSLSRMVSGGGGACSLVVGVVMSTVAPSVDDYNYCWSMCKARARRCLQGMSCACRASSSPGRNSPS